MTSRWRSALRGAAFALWLVGGCGRDASDPDPAVVGILRVSAVGQTAVRLAWLRADAVQTYRVERRTGMSGSFVQVAEVAATGGDSVVFLDTSVAPETLYGYRVLSLDAFGGVSDPSNVGGVLTPPRPSIDVIVISRASEPTQLDPDGYVVRVAGPDTASGIVAAGARVIKRFSPLRPGAYSVGLEGLATNCRDASAGSEGQPSGTGSTVQRQVEVVDTGVNTVTLAQFEVDCRDATRGDIRVNVTVSAGADSGGVVVKLEGIAADSTLPDSERAVLVRRSIASETGGAIAFTGLRPGVYSVSLEGVAGDCTASPDDAVRVPVAALDDRLVEFDLNCLGTEGGGGDKRFLLVSEWSTASVAVGAAVQADLRVLAQQGGPLQIAGVQALLQFPRLILRADSIAGLSGFDGNSSSFSNEQGNLLLQFVRTTAPADTAVLVGRIYFTVVGGAGSIARLTPNPEAATRVIATLSGDEFNGDDIGTQNGTLSVSGGGDQPPVATIAGPSPLTARVGVPLAVSASGSIDPEGGPLTYLWTFPSGSPPTATGESATVSYASAGTFVITLRVADAGGQATSTTRQVVVTATTGSNRPPNAVIAGPATLSVEVGQALSLSASGSSDPDGDALTYQWTLTGGAPATAAGANASVTYGAPGSYSVQLRVTDPQGLSSTATKPVVVSAPANGAPTAVIGGAATLTVSSGVPLAVSGAGSSDPEGGALTYAWSFVGGAPASASGVSASVTYATPGSYVIQLIVTDPLGAADTATRSVSVTPATNPQPFLWRSVITGPDQASLYRMAITLDLRQDIPETSGPEALASFRVDSIRWNPNVLQYVSTTFGPGISGGATFDQLGAPGRLRMTGSVVGGSAAGVIKIADVYFRAAPTPGSTTTTTTIGRLTSSVTTGSNFDYTSRTAIQEGEFPPTSSVGGGTVRGTVSRSGAGSQSLAGLSVVVDPDLPGAPTVTVPVTGSGGMVLYTATDVAPTSGVVQLAGLPAGCAAPAPAPFSGLAADGEVVVNLSVLCEAVGGGTGVVAGTLRRTGTGSQSLGGIRAVVVPTSGSPVTVSVSGTGATVSFEASGVVPGAGAVRLESVPSGCTAPVSTPYAGLTAGGRVTVEIDVTCDAPPSSTGTVRGALARTGGGSQSLAGITVTVTPAVGAAVPAPVVGAGASVTYLASGVTAGSGTITLSGLAAGCTAPAATPYAGLTAGGSVVVDITVTCESPSAGQFWRLSYAWGAPANGQVELTVTFDPSGYNDPSIDGAAPDAFAGLQAITALQGAGLGRLSAVQQVAVAPFSTLGPAPSLPSLAWLAAGSQNRTVSATVTRFRFTVGAGAAGNVVTVTSTAPGTLVIANLAGDEYPIVLSGAGKNLDIAEATLTLP